MHSSLCLNLILFSLLILTLICQVFSLRTPARSVKNCDTKSSVVPQFGGSSDNCKFHCWKTYISSSSQIILANKDNNSFEHELIGPIFQHGTERLLRPETCCCYYNVPWPKDLVKLEYVNRQDDIWGRTHSRTECLPIIVSLNLSKRTKDTYNELCRLLSEKRPLTMLELMKFIEYAAYLNYMQPKHPAIWKTLKAKEIKKLDMSAANEFKLIYREKLFDINRLSLNEYEGFHLGTNQLREFMSVKKLIPNALKSHIVAHAFDELVISHSLVDIAAASNYIKQINYNQLALPDHLLAGDYDKYDKSNQAHYFALDGLNCKLLRQISSRLTNYLSIMRALLSSLYEKLVYEVMGEKYKHLIELQQSERIYNLLMEINCKSSSSNG